MLAAATVHFPYMTAWPERASVEHRTLTRRGFEQIAEVFSRAEIQTLIVVTSEHIVNLQPRMAPAFTIGTAAVHQTFPEPQFNLPSRLFRGDPALAQVLLRGLYSLGFDLAHSMDLRLDHGTTLPLNQLDLSPDVAIIPIIINTLFPPLPTLDRCRALGEALSRTLDASGMGKRVAILATGGISHTVGAPGMEKNDPGFDQMFLEAIYGGDLVRACGIPDNVIDGAGNGTHEIRNWIVAAAACGPRKPRVITSIAFAPGWDSGVHQALWESQ